MSTFARPHSINEVLRLLDSHEWTPMAGATDIYPASVDTRLDGSFVDLCGIDELRGIHRIGDTWQIGATTSWSDIVRSDLPEFMAALQQAAAQIGGVQIQNAATVAGNLCTASPAGDSIPVLLTMDADVTLARLGSTRKLPLAEFIVGYRRTALEPGEVVTAIGIPHREAAKSSFQKLGSRSHLVISIVMASALVVVDGGAVTEVAIAVGACSPVPKRIHALEDSLRGVPTADIEDVIARYAFAELAPIDDIRGTADYRRLVTPRLVSRAIAECLAS